MGITRQAGNLKFDDNDILYFGSGASHHAVGDVSIVYDGTTWTFTGAATFASGITFSGALDLNAALDQDVALTAAGDAINSALTINHATAAVQGLDLSVTQLTTARTSGTVDGALVSLTSLAGDSGGVYNNYRAEVTDGGGTVTHNAFYLGAGFDTLIDASAAATGEADIVMGDNLASAVQFREAANPYMTFITTTGATSVAVAQSLTTTDGVASGTARTVGGRCVAADTGTAVTNDTAETASATYTIPANTLKEGTALRVTWAARATATNATDTLTGRLRLGGVTGTILQATTAVDVADDNVAFGSYTATAHGAPGAAVNVGGAGSHSTWAAAGGALVVDYLIPAAHATNGALDLVLTLEWSVASASNSAIVELFDVEIV